MVCSSPSSKGVPRTTTVAVWPFSTTAPSIAPSSPLCSIASINACKLSMPPGVLTNLSSERPLWLLSGSSGLVWRPNSTKASLTSITVPVSSSNRAGIGNVSKIPILGCLRLEAVGCGDGVAQRMQDFVFYYAGSSLGMGSRRLARCAHKVYNNKILM